MSVQKPGFKIELHKRQNQMNENEACLTSR